MAGSLSKAVLLPNRSCWHVVTVSDITLRYISLQIISFAVGYTILLTVSVHFAFQYVNALFIVCGKVYISNCV